jgi:hypothetical protein
VFFWLGMRCKHVSRSKCCASGRCLPSAQLFHFSSDLGELVCYGGCRARGRVVHVVASLRREHAKRTLKFEKNSKNAVFTKNLNRNYKIIIQFSFFAQNYEIFS